MRIRYYRVLAHLCIWAGLLYNTAISNWGAIIWVITSYVILLMLLHEIDYRLPPVILRADELTSTEVVREMAEKLRKIGAEYHLPIQTCGFMNLVAGTFEAQSSQLDKAEKVWQGLVNLVSCTSPDGSAELGMVKYYMGQAKYINVENLDELQGKIEDAFDIYLGDSGLESDRKKRLHDNLTILLYGLMLTPPSRDT
jgi:hypothetical protein